MLLSRQVVCQRVHDILVQDRTLGRKRVNLLAVNFPRDPVDKQGVLYSVELAQHRVLFELFRIQDSHKCVNKHVKLSDGVLVKVLVDEEHLNLMEFQGVLQGKYEYFHYPRI